ncbi:hypothetical protein BG846_03301 [Streptomyces fradiae ATCC 10745 = DSM 40063]|uniref:Uncharacterized protein n=1 Tax=Streptomyces fradiae ATCC 10745 = DSM 40063 TaxID=1319510 RepID=A0A1Y2NU54_STRFR|nr:hypothetical protein BG846_03301 [Streptomyces fradiae ATCC 10745 = DSM 40063]
MGGGAPAGRQVVDAAAGEDGPQDVGPGAGPYPQRFGEVPAGPYDLVVEERGVQALAAHLRRLFEDAVVGGVPGEGGAGAGLAGALDRGGAGGGLVEANRYFRECLPGQPAGRGAGARPGEGGEGGVEGAGRPGPGGEGAVGFEEAAGGGFEPGAVGGAGQAPGGPVDGDRDEERTGRRPRRAGQGGHGPQQVAAPAVHQQVGETGRVGVEDLAGAVAGEVVGAARGEAAAVAGGGDECGARFVGEGHVQVGVRKGLLGRRDDDVVEAGVLGEGAGALQLGGVGGFAGARGEVVEGDGEEALAGVGAAVPGDRAGYAGQARGEEGEGAGGAATGKVGTDAGRGGLAAGGAPVGGSHAGHGTRVGRGAGRCVAGGGEAGAYGFDQGVADSLHGAVRVELGRGDGEGGDGLVPGDLAGALAQHQGVAGRDALDAGVRGGVAQRLGGLGAGEQRGEVPDVELGLDEVGEGQRGGRVRGAVRPGGVEDGAGAREVGGDGDAAAGLHDGRVAARPGGEMAERAAARGEQADLQLVVGRGAAAQHGEADVGRDADDPHLVGAPVADRPQGVRVGPQELTADRLHRAAVVGGADRSDRPEARGDTAPPHQPAHRRLHSLWTSPATRGPPGARRRRRLVRQGCRRRHAATTRRAGGAVRAARTRTGTRPWHLAMW